MMYTVTKKRLSPNTVWDGENGKILCRFEKGTLVTDDELLANKLAAMGHTVVRTDDEADVDAGIKNSEDQSQKAENGADTGTGETKKAANRKSRK